MSNNISGGLMPFSGGLMPFSGGQILGQSPDKSLKSFPPCYSQSPLQLCFKIIFLLTHATSDVFLQTHATSYSDQLLYTVKEKGEKPDRKRNCMFMISASIVNVSMKQDSPYSNMRQQAIPI